MSSWLLRTLLGRFAEAGSSGAVIVNAELDQEQAVGFELVPEQVKVIHVGQHGRKVHRLDQQQLPQLPAPCPVPSLT
jgi:hypothetical protein